MKKSKRYNVLLHNKADFRDCLKEEYRENKYFQVDCEKYDGIAEGRIYLSETIERPVDWIDELNNYTAETIEKDSYLNRSNKAIMILKYNDRLFSFVYGYGRTMLLDSSIEKNFGLKTVINLIEKDSIKSINSLNISSDYVDIQKQSLDFSAQNLLIDNTNTDILKSITGKASKESIFSSLNGSDNFIFSASIDETIQTILEKIIESYESDKYKENGFEWIDHIQVVKDEKILEGLNKHLCEMILTDSESIIIAPNHIFNFNNVQGFFISGMRVKDELDNYYSQIPKELFIDWLRNYKSNDILKSLNSSALMYWDSEDGVSKKISSVYNCLCFETLYNENKYFLNNGSWFKVEDNYYASIVDEVNNIPTTEGISPLKCELDWDEEEYSKNFVKVNHNEMVLFDKVNFQLAEFGKSKIEPADIITVDKKFIHIKKGGSSSTLSHLFFQGLVSARLLKNEKKICRLYQ
nr:DUF6119 family protein [Streptococcus uberis]